MTRKAIEDLYWHDGTLTEMSFTIDAQGRSTVKITPLLYRDERATSRDLYEITCEGVLRFNGALDAGELRDNMFAGHISNGYLKGNTLWIYFTDGVLEVHAQRFDLAAVHGQVKR